MSHTADIIRHYRDKGLHGKELRAAVDRHARIIGAHDSQVAFCLREARLIGERRFAEPADPGWCKPSRGGAY